VAGGGRHQGRDTQAHLPGPVPARQRDPVRPGAAHRQDRRHAPRAQGEPARAEFTRRPAPEEDGGVAVLRPPLLLHTLGEPRHVNIQPAAAEVKLVKSDFHPKMTKIPVETMIISHITHS